MKEKTNLGVKPLGRGDEASAVVVAEIAALKQYGEALRAAGPVNNEAAAKACRVAHLVYAEAFELARGDKGCIARAAAKVSKLKALYDTLKLDY